MYTSFNDTLHLLSNLDEENQIYLPGIRSWTENCELNEIDMKIIDNQYVKEDINEVLKMCLDEKEFNELQSLALEMAFNDIDRISSHIHIPKNPYHWTTSDVKTWLIHMFQLDPSLNYDLFHLNGEDITKMSINKMSSFLNIQLAQNIHSELEIWKNVSNLMEQNGTPTCIEKYSLMSVENEIHLNHFPKSESRLHDIQTYKSLSNYGCAEENLSDSEESGFYSHSSPITRLDERFDMLDIRKISPNFNLPTSIQQDKTKFFHPYPNRTFQLLSNLPSQSLGSPQDIYDHYGDSLGSQKVINIKQQPACDQNNDNNHNLISELLGLPDNYFEDAGMTNTKISSSMKVSKCGERYKARPPQNTHLWFFLKELLDNSELYGNYLRWSDREKAIFRIYNSYEVAKLWGKRKNRPAMNYDKLSRSLRQYYKKGIMRKTKRSQRLVYQFVGKYAL
ncbi:transcription factor ets-4-like isoform X2 [Gordionus sp. m RMFG-2023]|uniref:transcription factor ets-4-like isoform X2 n=1 Tax=Gordionus sp. m RMFG-2023 TaxID=3053472 RepID=UPI0031FE38B2